MRNKFYFLFLFISNSIFGQFTIDPSFNQNGTNEFIQFSGNVVNGQKIAYNADQSIIVAGRWNDQLTIWKYLQNGTLDTNFGQGGLSAIPMPNGIWTLVKDLQILPDGRIVVLADALLFYSPNIDYSQCSIALARFLPNGMPDPSFNNAGLLLTRPQISYEYMSRTLEVTADGSLFVGGYSAAYGHYSCASAQSDYYAWFIAKFLENCAYDTSFNNTGYIQRPSVDIAQNVFQPQTYNASILDIQVGSDQSIVFAGAFNGQDHGYFSGKLLANGDYDLSYALNGRSPIHDPAIYFPANDGSYAYIQPDQSILYVAQYVNYGNPTVLDSTFLRVYKMNATGSVDQGFANLGELQFSVASNQVRLSSDNQGRLVFCWYSKRINGSQEVGFRRYLPNGTLDQNFGSVGTLIDEPLANDPFMNMSSVNDLVFNPNNTDLSIVSYRSANYVPTSFRVLNYLVDTTINTTQIIENELNDVELYPCPVTDAFTLDTKRHFERGKIAIFDLKGSLIYAAPIFEYENRISTNNWQPGTYLISIELDQHLYHTKVSKL